MDALATYCKEKNLDYKEVASLIELYGSDDEEEVILEKIETYPDEVREAVANLIFPGLPDVL